MKTRGFAALAVCAGSLGFAPAAALGDLFFEVTVSGDLPDGNWESMPIGALISYDVWTWGTGDDQVLFGAMFNVGAVESGDLLIGSIGKANPGGQFTASQNGVIGFIPETIFEVLVLSFPGVDIGGDPATATRIYAGFTSAFIDAGGRLNTSGWNVETGGGKSPKIHSFGIFETPTPGSVVLMATGGALLALRRSRA